MNRVAFLRTDHAFLSAAVTHPSTCFLLMKDLAPLAKDPSGLHYTSYNDVRPLIGPHPFTKSEEQLIAEYNSSSTTPLLVFLGLDEQKEEGLAWSRYRGAPYFALDVSPREADNKVAQELVIAMEEKGLKFLEGRVQALPAPQGTLTPKRDLRLHSGSCSVS